MQIPFYFAGQFRKYIFAFADFFNGVQIARFNPDGTIHHTETVPLLFPDQDKYFSYYNQKYTGGSSVNPDMKIELGKSLPNFTIGDLGFGIDQARMRNKYDLLCEATKHAYVATPYRINMNLRLNFEKLEECFQVIEQLFPLFNTQMSVNVNPIDQDFANNLSCPIILESQSNLFPSDLPEDDERQHQFTMSFRMDVWLFGRVIDNSEITSVINFNEGTK
jgi:hypothetical protein